jgi:hypothetical protein
MLPEPTLSPRQRTRSFTTDMFADFQVTGSAPPANPVNLEAAGPFRTNLQVENLDPGEYTVQFSVLNASPGAGGTLQVPAPRAEVVWKVAGQQLRRLVSVVNGAGISGVAEAVHIKIQDQSGVFSSLIAGATYKVVGTLSRGTRATTMQPPTLISLPAQLIQTGSPSNPLILQVPQDAGVISTYIEVGQNIGGSPIPVGDVVAYFFDAGGTVRGATFPLIQTGWVPLPAGTFTVQVRTTQPAPDSIFVQPIWGIEG